MIAPVRIGQDAEFQHRHAVVDEQEVDLAFFHQPLRNLHPEIGVTPTRRIGRRLRHGFRIGKSAQHHLDRIAPGPRVEIAGTKDRILLPDRLADPGDQQFGRLMPRHGTDMVEMRVEKVKHPTRGAVLHLGPRTDPVQSGVPAFRHLLGRFGEPECSAVEYLNPVDAVENR